MSGASGVYSGAVCGSRLQFYRSPLSPYPADLIAFGECLKATVLFYSNFHFLKQVGYFDAPAISKPLLHTWSLSVEEQFYALWPLLLLLLAKFVPSKRIVPVLLSIAGISLLLAQLKLEFHPKDPFLCLLLPDVGAYARRGACRGAASPFQTAYRGVSNRFRPFVDRLRRHSLRRRRLSPV